MQQQQKRFGFRPTQKPLKLLALAFALTAAAVMFMGFQIGTDPLDFDLLIPIAIKPPFNRLFLWLVGLVLGVFAAGAWKQASAEQGKRFELDFLEGTVVRIDPAKPGAEQQLFRLSEVDWFRVTEKRDGKSLDIRLTNGTSPNGTNGAGFASQDMDSLEEFDRFVARLRETLGSDKERH